MNQISNFFKRKRVFITGHTGCKGSWLTNSLVFFGANVMGFSKKDNKIRRYKNICYFNKVKNIYSDILNYSFLKKKIIRFNPEIIIHLAAQSIVSDSYKDP